MITLPWWLLILVWLLSLAATVWVTIHMTMWAGGRLEAEELHGRSKEEFPWNWRVLVGAKAYFDWLTRRLAQQQRDG